MSAETGEVHLCPVHDERTPSCAIKDGTWLYCYGCGWGGSVIDLAAHMWDIQPRGAGFVELVSQLEANLLGVIA